MTVALGRGEASSFGWWRDLLVVLCSEAPALKLVDPQRGTVTTVYEVNFSSADTSIAFGTASWA